MRRFYVFYDRDRVTIVPYDTTQHSGIRFFYFIDEGGDETLLVGSSIARHHDPLTDFNRQSKHGQLNVANLQGGGLITERQRRYVSDWMVYVDGHSLHTPKELRPRILELLSLPA